MGQRRGYVAIPNLLFDSGVSMAIGREAWLVYIAIRRFVRRRRPDSRILADLMKEGWIVARANQTTFATLLGMSRSTVTRAIALLKQIGWIDDVRIKDNGRGYMLGVTLEPEPGKRAAEVYWADYWIEATMRSLPETLRGWRHAQVNERARAMHQRLQDIIDADGAHLVRRTEATVKAVAHARRKRVDAE